MNLDQFINMGGYAAFVWPSYAVALVVLIGNLIAARASHRRAVAEAQRRAAQGAGS
jgi:heme exporter protein D